LVPVVVRLLRQSKASLIFFVPYVVHILFHNYGPFFNDNVIWFVIAAIAAVNHDREAPVDAARTSIASRTLRSRRMHPAYRSYTAGAAD